MVAENGTDGVSTAATPTSYVNRDELLSLRVVAGQKRIFLALCENDRGRYLKISDGRSKLIVPDSGIPDLRSSIDALQDYVVNHPEENVQSPETAAASSAGSSGQIRGGHRSSPPEPLHCERFISEGRKFYLDLLENDRGQYVKMSQATTRRISMIFPADALRHLQNAMTQIDELAPPDPTVPNANTVGHTTRTVERQTLTQTGGTVLMKAVRREIRVEGKRIVFESGANRRGSYLRITENTGITKMWVTLPHSAIPRVLNLLQEVNEAGDPLEDLRAAEAAADTSAGAQEQ